MLVPLTTRTVKMSLRCHCSHPRMVAVPPRNILTASRMGQSLLILSRSWASCHLLCVLQHQRRFFCSAPMLWTLTLVAPLTPVCLPECISPKLCSIPKSIGRTLRARSRNTSCQWEQWDVSTSHQSKWNLCSPLGVIEQTHLQWKLTGATSQGIGG